MKNYVMGLFAVVLAIGFTAFTNMPTKKRTTYYYTFNGTQSIDGRKVKTDYTNPSQSQPSCPTGTNWECTVQIKNITGTPPSDISSFNVTFDSNGFPNGGTDSQSNVKKSN